MISFFRATGGIKVDSIDPWEHSKKIFASEFQYLSDYIKRDHLSSIYDIQTLTNSFLIRVIEEEDHSLLDSLCAIYLKSLQTLQDVKYYPAHTWRKLDSVELDSSYKMWLFPRTRVISGVPVKVRQEYHLSSSQFLFLISQVIYYGSSIPEGRHKNLDSLIRTFSPILLDHHYKRWVIDTESFSLSGWGCAKGYFNHHEFLELKRRGRFWFKPKICPVITDTDLFIISGVANMVASFRKDSTRVSISEEDLRRYIEYLSDAEKLLKERIEFRAIETENGSICGFAFDNGKYIDYKDHKYALYEEMTFPAKEVKHAKSKDASWDLSHARRFFFVFNSLKNVKQDAGLTIDYDKVLRCLAHQFYHVIYVDKTRHLFTNYINGDNGWYRVGYHNEGFGYPPYSMSQAALEGGWFYLGKYYKPVAGAGIKILNDLQEEPSVYNKYYGVIFRNFTSVTRNFTLRLDGSERFVLLQWLPSI